MFHRRAALNHSDRKTYRRGAASRLSSTED